MEPRSWSCGLKAWILSFPRPCCEMRRNLASISTTSHIRHRWLNRDNCFERCWEGEERNPAVCTGHCTREIQPAGCCRRSCPTHGASLALAGRCGGVFRSWWYISIPSPPGAAGVTLALTKTRPDFEHEAAARGIFLLPAQLCWALTPEEADGSGAHVSPRLRSHRRATELCSGTRERLWSWRQPGSQPCPPALQGRGAPSPSFPHRTPRSAPAMSPALHPPLTDVLWGSSSFSPRASLLRAQLAVSVPLGQSPRLCPHWDAAAPSAASRGAFSCPRPVSGCPGRAANRGHDETRAAPRTPAAGSEGKVPLHGSPAPVCFLRNKNNCLL